MLRREGWVVNHKRIYRLYKLLGLQLRYKNKKKRPSHARVPIAKPQKLNQCWGMDFISDRLDNGQQLRILAVESSPKMRLFSLENWCNLQGQVNTR